eukprot:s279_g5.t5
MNCRFPMPVAGLPGIVPAPPEVGLEDEEAEEAIAAEEVDSIDPETPALVEVPSQPWAEDLGRSVGGFTRSAPGGGTTGADKDDEAAAEAVKPKLPEAARDSTLRRRPKLVDSTNELDRLGLEDLPPEEAAELRSSTARSQFEVPVHDLDDGFLPLDDFDEEAAYDGPMPEFSATLPAEPFVGDPFGDDWANGPDMSRFPAVDIATAPRAEEASGVPHQRGKKHRWFGMTKAEIKEAKALEKSQRRLAKRGKAASGSTGTNEPAASSRPKTKFAKGKSAGGKGKATPKEAPAPARPGSEEEDEEEAGDPVDFVETGYFPGITEELQSPVPLPQYEQVLHPKPSVPRVPAQTLPLPPGALPPGPVRSPSPGIVSEDSRQGEHRFHFPQATELLWRRARLAYVFRPGLASMGSQAALSTSSPHFTAKDRRAGPTEDQAFRSTEPVQHSMKLWDPVVERQFSMRGLRGGHGGGDDSAVSTGPCKPATLSQHLTATPPAALQSVVTARINGPGTQGPANTAWAPGSTVVQSKAFVEALGHEVAARLLELSAQNLSNATWDLAKTTARNVAPMSETRRAAARLPGRGGSQIAANLLWSVTCIRAEAGAIAKVESEDSRSVLVLVDQMLVEVGTIFKEMDTRRLATTLRSLAAPMASDAPPARLLLEHVCCPGREPNVQDASSTLWALASPRCQDGLAVKVLLHHAKSLLPEPCVRNTASAA